MLFDMRYLILVMPAIALAALAQIYVSSTFSRNAKVPSRRGASGAQAARRILDANGLGDVGIEEVGGRLSDHYDPRTRVLRLSPEVARGSSVASIGVAAHEAGHALQHARGYAPMALRSGLVPIANIGSSLALPLIFAGVIFRFSGLITVGILFFAAAVLFQVVTLPVEFNASRRAIAALAETGSMVADEERPVRSVLTAAALTYLAAALVSVMQLVYFMSLGSDRD